MFRKVSQLCFLIVFAVSTVSFAQNSLDGRPLNPEKDPDIDMFMGSWQNSIPYNTHGAITERAVFTKSTGDPLKPHKKAAVLKFANRFARATIDGFDSTTPTTLRGEQEIFYITSGKGIIKAGGKTHDLYHGIFLLVPANLEFTITNTGDELLEMYIINEPIPEGFRPNSELLVKDENTMPFRNDGYLSVHWSHNGKNVFNVQDGLGTLELVNCLTFNAMTIGQPHSHEPGVEEVWAVVEGINLAFLGKEIRWQYPGTAYMIPPTGFTPHSNINTTEKPIKFLYYARFREHELRK
ncbi:cupin domain-containing protein [Candidatus Latescibacterota bacterium]